ARARRRRETLAAAAPVQSPPTPAGIPGALKKTGGLKEGSRISTPEAAEVAHMFFASAFLGGGLGGLLATHPPLLDRIRRLDPQFDGTFPAVRPVGVEAGGVEGARPRPGRPRPRLPPGPGVPPVPVPAPGGTAPG